MTDISIYVVQYAISDNPVGNLLYGSYNAGTVATPYSFYLLESADGTWLVDTGFAMDHPSRTGLAQRYGIRSFRAPEDVLADLGIGADTIAHVILTHAHFDHMGNIGAFPKAMFYLQERELAKSLAALAAPPRLSWLASALLAEDIRDAVSLVLEGRLRLIDGDAKDLLPGIDARSAHDTHSYGSQYLIVATGADNSHVLCGDVAFSYANVSGEGHGGMSVPIGFAVGSQERCIRAMDTMLRLVDDDVERIVPLHDPGIHLKFPSRGHGDGLYIVEIHRRDGGPSLIAA